MIGGYIGLGIGIPLVSVETGIAEGVFSVAGTSTAAPVGASDFEAVFNVAGVASTALVPGQTTAASFAVAGAATIDARSFTDVAEGAAVVAGQASISAVGAFAVPRIFDAVPDITAGSGKKTIKAGSATRTIGI